jgi:hypothetical protein
MPVPKSVSKCSIYFTTCLKYLHHKKKNHHLFSDKLVDSEMDEFYLHLFSDKSDCKWMNFNSGPRPQMPPCIKMPPRIQGSGANFSSGSGANFSVSSGDHTLLVGAKKWKHVTQIEVHCVVFDFQNCSSCGTLEFACIPMC